MPPRQASKLGMAAALAAVYFFWASTFVGIKVAVETLPPLGMAAARFAVAGGLLVAWALARGAGRPTASQWRAAAFVGVLMIAGGNGAVTWAEGTGVGSGVAALAVSASPVWLVLVDRVRYGNRVSRIQMLGVLGGLAGMFVLVNPTTSPLPLLPAVMLVASGLVWAVGTLSGRSPEMAPDATLANGMTMAAGGAGLLVLSVLVGEPAHASQYHLALRPLLGAAWLVVFGSIVGFSCYLWLIRVAPVALVSTQSYVSPVIAILLGAGVLGEQITPRTLLAGGVILASVIVVASAPLLTRRRPEPKLAIREAA